MRLPPEIENMATPRLREQLKHSVSHCALDGPRLWQNPLQSENLFEVVARMDRYIVDSNSNWKAESKIPANKNIAFILGQTVTTEEDNLKSLYFGRKVDISNGNLFHFGLDDMTGELLVALERLDPAFALIFDRERLNEESRLRSKRTDSEFRLRELDESAAIENEKRAILDILGVDGIHELPEQSALASMEDGILSYIRATAPSARFHWYNSIDVARRCYTLLLIQSQEIRREFAEPNYRNVLGDVMLVQNALFLRSPVLSDDHAAKKMTSYISLPEIVCKKSV